MKLAYSKNHNKVNNSAKQTNFNFLLTLPISSVLLYSRPGVTNLFAIVGNFFSYRWVSRWHNFSVIL